MPNRNKVITIRVNENKYNEFLKIVEQHTEILTFEYPSRTEKHYYTKFPDQPYSGPGKYTLADLVNTALTDFINKYKSDI